ncbi:MAG TPA: NUDIX domain-containing protein [Micromonosporaceae bacterium]|nr:NUDIX domain-containing protein [Micromonosporaceae bacterium]
MAMSQRDSSAFVVRPGARVLLVDGMERVLLLRGSDPANPTERYWFTVGGGVDTGETRAQAAARELWEETGLAIPPDALGEPVWQEVAEFPFDGHWYRQDQEFFLMRVPRWDVNTAGWEELERRTVDQIRWWKVDELESTDETYYPAELPVLLRRLLAG